MLRKALEMSKDPGPNNQGAGLLTDIAPANEDDQVFNDLVNVALEYGFDADIAVQAISMLGKGAKKMAQNPDQFINYLMSL